MSVFGSIPTRYRDVQFRSRLEARWAAFFDIARWPWEYEPVDFNGWIPDFRIGGVCPAFFEVKPIDFSVFSDLQAAQAEVDAAVPNVVAICNKMRDEVIARERAAGDDEYAEIDAEAVNPKSPFPFNHEVIVLGLAPSSLTLGMFLREQWGNGRDWAMLYGGRWPYRFDYAADQASFRYRVGGEYDGDGHLIPLHAEEITAAWREAGNRVQWRRPIATEEDWKR